jgi:uncharacterized peroxidase-related enzyme
LSALEKVEWEPCVVEPASDAEIERQAREAFGVVPDWVPYFIRCPWIVRSIVDFERLQLAHTDLEFAELVALVVSQDNSCRYCYAAHRVLLRVLGMPESAIRRLEEDLLVAELSPRMRQGLEFARRVSRSSPLPSAADREALLAAGYEPAAIDELAFIAAMHVYNNRISTLPAIPPANVERMPHQWFMRVFRPLFAWRLRRRQARHASAALPVVSVDGPFGALVRALGDLPAAACLRRVLDDAFASPFLSLRAKALVFSVVGRGLGCPTSECEASRLLTAEGLDKDAQEGILARLASPRLDAVESIIVPFARETIWYRPADIQKQARAIRCQLTAEQFLELIGIAALANAVCRMCAAVALPH